MKREKKLNLNNSLEVIASIKDEETGKHGKVIYLHTEHSSKRSHQRGLSDEQLSFAIQYGEETFKQGLIYYTVRDKDLPNDVDPQKRKKFKNLVLVTSMEGNIITCYKSRRAHKTIKLKRKRLGKFRPAA